MLRSIFVVLLSVFTIFAQDIIYNVRAVVVPADTSQPFYELEVFAEGHPESYLKNSGNFGTIDGHPILLVPAGSVVKFEAQVKTDGRPGVFQVRLRYSDEWLDNNTLVVTSEMEFLQLQLCGLDQSGNIRASFLLEVVVRPEVKPVVKVVGEGKYKKYLLYKKKQLEKKIANISDRESELERLQQKLAAKKNIWIGSVVGFDLTRNSNLSFLYSGNGTAGLKSDINFSVINNNGSYFGYNAIANFWFQPFGIDLDLTVAQMEQAKNRERSYFSIAAMRGWQFSDYAAVFFGANMNKYFRSNTDQGQLPQPAGYDLTLGVSQRKSGDSFLSALVNISGDVWRGVSGEFGSIYLSNLPPTVLYNYNTLLNNGFSLAHLFASNDDYFIIGLKAERGNINYLWERLFVENYNYPEFGKRFSGFLLWNSSGLSWYVAGQYRPKINRSNGPLSASIGLFFPVKQAKFGLSIVSDTQKSNQAFINIIFNL